MESSRSDRTPYTIAYLAPDWAKDISKKSRKQDPRITKLITETEADFATITASKAFARFVSTGGGAPTNLKIAHDGIYFQSADGKSFTHILTLIKATSTDRTEASNLSLAARRIMEKARAIFAEAPAPSSPTRPPAGGGSSGNPSATPSRRPSLEASASPPPAESRKLQRLTKKVTSCRWRILMLKSQLKAARDEKRKSTVDIWRLEKELTQQAATLQKYKEKQEALLGKLGAQKQTLAFLQPRCSDLEQTQVEHVRQIRSLEERVARKKRDIEAIRAALSSLQAENTNLSLGLLTATTRFQELQGKVDELRGAAESNTTALARLAEAERELQAGRQELTDLRAASTQTDAQIRDLSDALTASICEQSRLQLDLATKTEKLCVASAKIAELEPQLAVQARENTTLRADVERLERAAEEAAGLQPGLEAATKRADELSADVRRLEEELRTRFSQLQEVTDIRIGDREPFKDYLTRIREVRTDLESQIHSLQQELAGHTALREELRSITQEKEAAEARLSTLTTLSEQIKTTLGMRGSLSIEEILGAAKAALERQADDIARLTSELDGVRASLSEETSRHQQAEEDLRTNLSQLRQKLATANAEAAAGSADADERYRSLNARFTEMEAQLTREEEELQKATLTFTAAKSDLARLTAEAASDKETIASLQSEKDKLTEALNVASTEIGRMKAELVLKTEDNAALEARIREAEARRDQAISALKQAELTFTRLAALQADDISAKDRKIIDLEVEISAIRGQVALAGSDKAELQEKLKAAEDELEAVRAELEAQLADAKAQAAASEEKLTTALEEISGYKGELKAAKRAREDLDDQLRKSEALYTDTLEQVELALGRAITDETNPEELCRKLESSKSSVSSGLADSLRAIYQSMQETKQALAAKDAQITALQATSREQEATIKSLQSLLRRALHHTQSGLGETEHQSHPTALSSIPTKVEELANLAIELKKQQKAIFAEQASNLEKIERLNSLSAKAKEEHDRQIDAYEARIDLNNSQIEQFKQKASEKDSEIGCLKDQLDKLQRERSDTDTSFESDKARLEENIAKLQAQSEQYLREKQRLEERNASQASEIETCKATITELQKELEEQRNVVLLGYEAGKQVLAKNQELEAQINQLTASYKIQLDLKQTLLASTGFETTTALQGELEQIRSLLKLQDSSGTASERIRQLKEDLVMSQNSRAQSAALIEHLGRELEALKSSSSTELVKATTKALALTTELEQQKAIIRQVEAEKRALQEANAKLEAAHKAKVSDLEKAIGAQRRTIQDLEESVSTLRAALQASEAAKSQLERETAALQTELAKAKEDLAASTAENESLRGRVQKLTTERDGFIATIDAQKGKIAVLRFENIELKRRLREHEIRELERAARGNFSLETAYEEALSGPPELVPPDIAAVVGEAEAALQAFTTVREIEKAAGFGPRRLNMEDTFPIDHLLLTGRIRLGYEKSKPTLIIDSSILPHLGLRNLDTLSEIAERQRIDEVKIGETLFYQLTIDKLADKKRAGITLFDKFVDSYLKEMVRTIKKGGKAPQELARIVHGLSSLNTYCRTLRTTLIKLQKDLTLIKTLEAQTETPIEVRTAEDPALIKRKSLLDELQQLKDRVQTAGQVVIDSVQMKMALAKNLISIIALYNSVGTDSTAVSGESGGKKIRDILIPTKNLISFLLSQLDDEILGGPTATAAGGGGEGFALAAPSPAASARPSRRGDASGTPSSLPGVDKGIPMWKHSGPRYKPRTSPGPTIPKASQPLKGPH